MARGTGYSPSHVAPSPEVLAAIRSEMRRYRTRGEEFSTEVFRPVPPAWTTAHPYASGLNSGAFYPEDVQRRSAPARASRSKVLRHPTTGRARCLVLLVDFSDNPGHRTPNDIRDMLFSRSSYSSGSMRDYFLENSYLKFDVDGEVIGWLRMPETYAYYVDGQCGEGAYPHNSQRLAEDALALALHHVNLGQFDTDGDSFLDGLFIVHAGDGAESDSNRGTAMHKLWSHKWNLTSSIQSQGITAYTYVVVPEPGTLGVYCHEFGHILGLPDLYDTTHQSSGVGQWCVMGSGNWNNHGLTPSHFCAWAKTQLSWLQPPAVARIQQVGLPCIEHNPTAVSLWPRGQVGSEYFLLENRQLLGFDAELPAAGLLIWHINERQINNDDPDYYLVGLEQADASEHLELGVNEGDAGDPYPGSTNNTAFDDTSMPGSSDHSGARTGVSATNISLVHGQANIDVAI